MLGFKKIQLAQVKSEAIRSLSYNHKKHLLQVRFNSGSVYEYGAVERETFNDFVNAESIGRFFQGHIKDVYPWRRVS